MSEIYPASCRTVAGVTLDQTTERAKVYRKTKLTVSVKHFTTATNVLQLKLKAAELLMLITTTLHGMLARSVKG